VSSIDVCSRAWPAWEHEQCLEMETERKRRIPDSSDGGKRPDARIFACSSRGHQLMPFEVTRGGAALVVVIPALFSARSSELVFRRPHFPASRTRLRGSMRRGAGDVPQISCAVDQRHVRERLGEIAD